MKAKTFILGLLGLLIAAGVIATALRSGAPVRKVILPGGSGIEFDPPSSSPFGQNQDSPLSNSDRPNPTPLNSPSYPQNKVSINWGNLSQYFDIKGVKFERGFQVADSKLSFVAKAKGDFSGDLLVYFLDSENVKICPSVASIPRNCNLLGYTGYIDFSTKHSSNNYTLWRIDESDRLTISVPTNASTIEFSFNQSSF